MTESTKECMQSESTHIECTICLLNYTEETKKITECCHTFHTKCLDKWLQNNTSCPLCRTEMKPMSFIGTGEEDYFISNGIRLPVYRRNQIY